jgi:chloramphenicol O-acetyltransferase type A
MKNKIDLAHYKRRGMFAAFKDRAIPYFSVTANVDITHLKEFVDQQRCGFFVAISFLISHAVNRVPELRHRMIDGELYEFSQVDPGFTVLLDDQTFSFCDARHDATFAAYREQTTALIRQVKERPDQSTGEKHHMFFITDIPWFSFTAIVHPYDPLYGSIPVISIGKYFTAQAKVLVPIGVQVNHGLVDAFHVGQVYAHLEAMCHAPAAWLGPTPPTAADAALIATKG